jgi:polar amino acid transport system substrate-binding protein
MLNLIKDQAGRRTLKFIPTTSAEDGMKAITSGKADIACGVAFDWGRAEKVSYTIPFAIGGTRLLTKTTIDGTPSSLRGRTVGVVKDSSSAKILEAVVPGASLQAYATPAEAFAAYDSGKISTLAGGTLWLAANSDAKNSDLVPIRPYGRTGIGCIVKQNNGKLLAAANNAIGQTMQEYVIGNAATREMVNRWIGPGSNVMLPEPVISALYSLLLSTTSEMSVSPN